MNKIPIVCLIPALDGQPRIYVNYGDSSSIRAYDAQDDNWKSWEAKSHLYYYVCMYVCINLTLYMQQFDDSEHVAFAGICGSGLIAATEKSQILISLAPVLAKYYLHFIDTILEHNYINIVV